MDEEDPEYYEAFRFHFIPFKRLTEGGNDDNSPKGLYASGYNDCLVNCINQFFECVSKYVSAKELKKYLNLNRDDKIDISRIKEVERFINTGGFPEKNPYAIFISGDASYDSNIQTFKRIYITLSGGHYSINKDKIKKQTCKNYEEKRIVMIEFVGDVIEAFDGEKNFVVSREEYTESFNKYLSSPIMYVKKNYSAKTKNLSIEDAYHSYIAMADELKTKSNGLFNFYKTPTIKNMALNYFYDLTKAIQPEDISNNEALWINEASTHALTYYEPYEGDIHIFDINSRYPHIMQKNNIQFPIAEGEFKTVKEFDKSLFGIYRCKIFEDETKKFFTFNPKNYYTHSDIIVAQEYGLKISIIQDGKPNFLYYSKDKLISGQYLFKKYVEKLYELKQNKVKGAKDILNILWGALTEKKIYKPTIKLEDDIDLSGVDIHYLHTEGMKMKTHITKHNDSQFRTNYGRIKPFILSFSRSQMFFSFRKWEPLIKRMHTDSLYMTEIPKDMLPYSDKLGQLKHEYSGPIKIISLNKTLKI